MNIEDGFAVVPHFISLKLAQDLLAESKKLFEQDAFHPAGVGRNKHIDSTLRGDCVHWWNLESPTPAQGALLDQLHSLREALNRKHFLGLWDLECHYAIYPTGTHYCTHVDRFKNDDLRVVSFALYLNENWNSEDGGELELHLPNKSVRVAPTARKLACFLSDQIPHEVHRCEKTRYSITGWFRRRRPTVYGLDTLP